MHNRGLQPHGKGAYRMYFSLSISLQSPHAGGDADCRTAGRFCPAQSPHAGGDAYLSCPAACCVIAVSACGRGRPRTQDARGAIMPPIALSDENVIALQGLPRAQGGLQPARATSRPRRRASPRSAGKEHGSARIRRISTDDVLSGIARPGGLRLG